MYVLIRGSILDIHQETNAKIPCQIVKVSTSAVSLSSKTIDHFVGMGFSEEIVARAVQECGMASIYDLSP